MFRVRGPAVATESRIAYDFVSPTASVPLVGGFHGAAIPAKSVTGTVPWPCQAGQGDAWGSGQITLTPSTLDLAAAVEGFIAMNGNCLLSCHSAAQA